MLLPANLSILSNGEQRQALLAHELAHLLRRDHWVRYLEFLCMGLFWWHPVVWLARRALREAEEQCCDAWVVATLPQSGRAYALALVETLDFLSGARAEVPALASAIGPVTDLKRRLALILSGTTPRALGWGGAVLVFGLGALLLPALPGAAQEPWPTVIAAEALAVPDIAPQPVNADIQALANDLARRQAEFERAAAEVRAAEARLQVAHGKGMAVGAWELAFVKGEAIVVIERVQIVARTGEPVEALVLHKDGKAVVAIPQALVKAEKAGKVVLEVPLTSRPGAPKPDAGARIAELEKRLAEMIRELEWLRREVKIQRPERAGPPVPNEQPNWRFLLIRAIDLDREGLHLRQYHAWPILSTGGEPLGRAALAP
jgi:hypothetical protein